MATSPPTRILAFAAGLLIVGGAARVSSGACGGYVQITWRLQASLSPFELPPLWAVDELANGADESRPVRCHGPNCGRDVPVPVEPDPVPVVGPERQAVIAEADDGPARGGGRHFPPHPRFLLPAGYPQELLRPPSATC